jgi:hypothetical protein
VRGAVALILLASACACGEPPRDAEPFPLELLASTSARVPVAGVRVWADAQELGTTSARGALHAELRGREGRAVTLTSACPPGFRTAEARRRIVLQHLGALALRIACEPTERTAVLVVRARAAAPLAGVPIRRDGSVIGQTGADGTAHLMLTLRPGTALRLALDTAGWPELVPRDPVQSYTVADEDSLLLFDTAFAPRPKPRPRAARPPRAPALPAPERRPYRIH